MKCFYLINEQVYGKYPGLHRNNDQGLENLLSDKPKAAILRKKQ